MLVALAAFLPASAQPPGPKFEVATIRPSTNCGGGGDGGQMKSGPATIPVASPDRLFRCGPVSMLITIAYLASSAKGTQANPSARLIPNIPIEGGPDWVRSENYAITAKADRPVSRDMMEGPMMRALLEDRFKLKVHRGSRNGPAYALTVANGGIKLHKSTCTPPAFGPDAPPLPAGATPCPMEGVARRGSVLIVNRYAKNLSEFSLMLPMDRPVVDRTGVPGLFDFHLEFSPDDTSPFFQSRWQQLPDTAADDPAAGPSIFTALREQLGLKLSPVQAPREFLMIDSIERPSAN
jgi:uncharacterized protein (TIGR03435 family)